MSLTTRAVLVPEQIPPHSSFKHSAGPATQAGQLTAECGSRHQQLSEDPGHEGLHQQTLMPARIIEWPVAFLRKQAREADGSSTAPAKLHPVQQVGSRMQLAPHLQSPLTVYAFRCNLRPGQKVAQEMKLHQCAMSSAHPGQQTQSLRPPAPGSGLSGNIDSEWVRSADLPTKFRPLSKLHDHSGTQTQFSLTQRPFQEIFLTLG